MPKEPARSHGIIMQAHSERSCSLNSLSQETSSLSLTDRRDSTWKICIAKRDIRFETAKCGSAHSPSSIWNDSLVIPVRILMMEKEIAELVNRLKSRLSSCLYPVREWIHQQNLSDRSQDSHLRQGTCSRTSERKNGSPRALRRASPESTTFPFPFSILKSIQQPCANQCCCQSRLSLARCVSSHAA